MIGSCFCIVSRRLPSPKKWAPTSLIFGFVFVLGVHAAIAASEPGGPIAAQASAPPYRLGGNADATPRIPTVAASIQAQAAGDAAKRITNAARKRGRNFSESTSCDYYGCPDTYYISADEFDTFSITVPGKPDTCGEPQSWVPTAGQNLGGGVISSTQSTSKSQGTFNFLITPGAGGVGFQIGESTNGGFCQFPAYYTQPFAQAVVFVSVNPHSPSLDINTPCGPCSRNSTSGDPVDVISGAFWEDRADLHMPGPFGLTFTRHYNSEALGYSELGSHWSDNFDDTAFVYSSVVPASNEAVSASLKQRESPRKRFVVGSYSGAQSVYLDEYRMPHYYGTNGGYDPITNTTLSEDAGGSSSTLKFFDGTTYNFDSAGKLVKKTDRIGNSQTIARDSNELIRSVSDSLNRQLCFYYNGGDTRVAAVGEWFSSAQCPASVSSTAAYVSYVYDNGASPSGATNCTTGELCSVTEPDGKTWQYGYDINSNYPWNMTAIYDPLGNPEVVNSYSGYMIATQHRGNAGQIGGNLQFNYVQGLPSSPSDPLGHTQVTNPDTGEVTDYYFNGASGIRVGGVEVKTRAMK